MRERETAAVEVEGLTVRYGRKTALNGVSLSVGRGEVYALLGRNGSGKTSLVRCLLGHRRPDGGSARLFGQDAWSDRERVLARVGVVPEEPDAPPETTAGRLVRFSRRLYPSWSDESIDERLERFRVPLDVPFGRLSKGQKGQLMLALALAPEPDLLVLDDPTLGLDAVARQSLYDELIGELADRGTTVFITTHDLEGIEGIADRVGILRETGLAADEPLDRLKQRYRRLQLVGGATPDPARLRDAANGLGPVSVTTGRLGSEIVVGRYSEEAMAGARRTADLAEAEVLPMSLSDIFISMLAGDGSGIEGGKR
jgi:ABC-2 type transport system ATP-binding protein